MSLKSIVTRDGSHSLLNESLNEPYHSYHGALRESQYVFIEMGFKKCEHLPHLNIFEMGFGTGLNVLLSCLQVLHAKTHIHYTSIETLPLPSTIYTALNYPQLLEQKESEALFAAIHSSDWEKDVALLPNFILHKKQCSMQDFSFSSNIDLVYYDAFGPVVQAELWEMSIFEKIYDAMNTNAVFVTYCAKGQLRRDLQHIGFNVERLAGPPGKREMLRATK
jgi:tRNA U34 5-methylaminomethyl-2-thiouridine-forming methyltransferase MnmC